MSALMTALLCFAALVQDSPYGEPVDRLSLGLRVPGKKPVASLQDLGVTLSLQPFERDERLRVVLEGEVGQGYATPYLFTLEVARADGGPLDLPQWELGGRLTDAWRLVRSYAHTRELNRRHSFQVSLRDWYGWQGVVLPPGKYRMRAGYTGVPKPSDPRVGGKVRDPFPFGWKGEVRSAWRDFEIAGGKGDSDLEWSEELDGLRIAQRLFPEGTRYFFGERVRPEFIVENVSDHGIYFDRDLPASQSDAVRFHYHDDETLQNNSGRFRTSGGHPSIRWFLEPGQRAKIQGREIELSWLEGNLAGGQGSLHGPEGDYTVAFDVFLGARYGKPIGEAQPWPQSRLQTVGPVVRIMKRD